MKWLELRLVFAGIIVLTILLSPISFFPNASSSEGDPAPPGSDPNGGSGGGGGGFLFFDYYIPLIFDETHKDGLASVTVTIIQPSLMITSFQMDESGVNQRVFNQPTTITFNPSTSRGLTNGSLIRLTSPAQVFVHRSSQDDFADKSFGYTVLPDRMRGFEYKSPFDGYAVVFTEDSLTTVNFAFPNDTFKKEQIFRPFSTQIYPVTRGTYINTSEPTTVTFYSPNESTGYVATMGVPKFLRGNRYVIPNHLYDLSKDQLDFSTIEILPESPTEVKIEYENNSTQILSIFGFTQLALSSGIKSLTSIRADIDVSINIKIQYVGLIRSSFVQLIEAPEMRAGELFTIPSNFSASFAVLQPNTNLTVADYSSSGYVLANREAWKFDEVASVSLPGKDSPNIVVANDSLYGIAVSPGRIGHFMAPSTAFVLLPLNQQTLYKNVTGIFATWYRFTNLAVSSIEIFPEPAEEFSSLLIKVTFISNGSLPAGNFKLQVNLDGEPIIEDEISFLQINTSLVYTYRTFLKYDTKNMSLSATIDLNNEVTEINEDDNSVSLEIHVIKNIRLRGSFWLFLILTTVYVMKTAYQKFISMRKLKRSRVDAILTIEEEP